MGYAGVVTMQRVATASIMMHQRHRLKFARRSAMLPLAGQERRWRWAPNMKAAAQARAADPAF